MMNRSYDDCIKAEQEVIKSEARPDISDKLFHYRRALRLCPEKAELHNGLGELYLSLNRVADAQFEFEEALRLNPRLSQAKQNLKRAQR